MSSRRKPKKQRRSTSQKILWLVSLLLVASMVVSLIIVALQPAEPVSLPENTEPVMGPELSTDTPAGGSDSEPAPSGGG